MAKRKQVEGEVPIARNARAEQLYDIEERFEAGLVLTGSEVKSMRLRRADLDGAYAAFQGEELFLHKMHVALYDKAGSPMFGHEPRRTRKLLMRRDELRKIYGRLTMQGYTLIPLRLYFKNGFAKVELGIAKGRKKGDEREAIKREIDRKEAREAMKRYAK